MSRQRQLFDTETTAAEARQACRRRRGLVLAHPDLAARLCKQPIGYAQPEQWTGYIPPETWNGQHNNTPRRAALLALVEAAEQRAKEVT